MIKTDKKYSQYLQILKEELIPAMGCTEPIAMAYAAAKARAVLGKMPEKIDIVISGNIIKNVKSVIVPNTGGLKGITAAIAAGVAVGNADKQLEVLADVKQEDIPKIAEFMSSCRMTVMKSQSDKLLDIDLHLYAGSDSVRLRITDLHTNIVLIEKNGKVLFEADSAADDGGETDRSVLNVQDIVDFAETVDIDDVRELLEKQIGYNLAISEEGLHGSYGASIGKTLIATRGEDVRVRARAQAAAGSDARMSGCELPVVIVSGSGNQGMTASLPVIVYANDMGASHERLLRALVVSNLITIHQKTPIGRLSAFCGAVSAGCGAAEEVWPEQAAGEKEEIESPALRRPVQGRHDPDSDCGVDHFVCGRVYGGRRLLRAGADSRDRCGKRDHGRDAGEPRGKGAGSAAGAVRAARARNP